MAKGFLNPSTKPAFCCHLAGKGWILCASKTAAFKFYRYSNRGVQLAITPASATVASNQTTTFTVTPDAGFAVASASGCDGCLIGAAYTRTVFGAAAYEFPYSGDS
tara:strand:- start:315 stop:632 length:318 start_codon:yes stop_codon:yes gene_type:complete